MGLKSTLIISLLALVPFVLLSMPFMPWIPDDAYISFEYSKNLADGDGLVFNAGERVEGFSNLLWTLLLAAAAFLGLEIETAAPVLSYLFALGALGVFLVLVRQTLQFIGDAGRPSVLIATGAVMLAVGAFFPLAFYASSGLETTAYLLFLLIGAFFHLKAVRQENPDGHYFSLFAFLAAALTRPEGIGFLGLNGLFLLYHWRKVPRRVLLVAFLTLAAYASVAAVKAQYFGAVLPNTYFAKPGTSWHYFAPLSRGIGYLVRFFGKSGLVFFLPFALVVPFDKPSRYAWLYLWVFACFQLFFIVFVGADILRFDRFAVPLVPWLLGLTALGVMEMIEGPYPHIRVFAGRLIVVCTIIVVALNLGQAFKAQSKYCVHDWMHSHVHREIGRYLGEALPADGRIVANEIGAIRYHSGRPVVDMLGLTDNTVSAIRYRSFQTFGIGSSAWSANAVTRYLLDGDPACVILPAPEVLTLTDRTSHRDSMHPLWYTILTDPVFEAKYTPRFYVAIHPRKFVYLFTRDDVALPAGVYPENLRCMEIHTLDG